METVLLTWRFQNVITIAIMVAILGVLATFAAQAMRRQKAGG